MKLILYKMNCYLSERMLTHLSEWEKRKSPNILEAYINKTCVMT